MSLILEALRKSEAERRRGQVPNLHAELPPAAQAARSGRPAWPWLVPLAIIAMVAASWLARGLWAPTPPAADPLRPSSADRARPAGADDTIARGGRPDAAAPVADVAPPAIELPDASTPVADILPAAAPPASARQRSEPAAPPAPDTGSGSDRAAAPVAAAAPANAVPVPRQSAPPAMPPAAATPAALDTPAPLRLSDLAAADRRALPPLKISMHMWAPTSPRRFAIIDGARVNEGDRLGEAVVDEITRDGVVLAWHGRRVHIPIH